MIPFAALSLGLGLLAYVPYLVEMKRGHLHPHLFSWLTWGCLLLLGFFLSSDEGGGAGAWIFALQSCLCFGVVAYALSRSRHDIADLDWLSFFAAIVALVVYAFSRNAIVSVLLAAGIDSLGFVPTFRKSFARPHSEPWLTYALSGLGFLCSLFALEAYTFVTMFYPIVLVGMNAGFVWFLFARRRALAGRVRA